jgi:DNA (cytosine-5)-methyltransferase 1
MIIVLKKEYDLGRKKLKLPIPVVDLFAGPGGLGEGFSAVGRETGEESFRICLSIEKDFHAHQTLELRSFFSQFPLNSIPDEYYEHIRGQITREELYSKYLKETEAAKKRARRAELGKERFEKIDGWIAESLKGARTWVLIGGPPCQAYSIVGRSRTGNLNGEDPRHFLYKEYLRIIAEYWPPVFVLENVKGLLSAKVKGENIFNKIMHDLRNPSEALKKSSEQRSYKYSIYSIVKRTPFEDSDPKDYVVKSEMYGIPQARHRIILLGVRDDLDSVVPGLLNKTNVVNLSDVITGLPMLRSGMTQLYDDPQTWTEFLKDSHNRRWVKSITTYADERVQKHLLSILNKLVPPVSDRGGEYISCNTTINFRPEWYLDKKTNGVCNHSTRAHISKDLYRYLYASCFAEINERSPNLRDFPPDLYPEHRNINRALTGNMFSDRFRVQVWNRPATTITSHISKDGHYYIHPDPGQCRSLTVREAARLQTFPDNYFFCGPRTAQYSQVGNAVPPLLAKQIGEIVYDILVQAGVD